MSSESPGRKPWWRRWFGSRSERAAVRFLRRKGYRILVRNFSCALGELDVVARDGDCIVFIEVRSTADEDAERPALSVDLRKQARLSRLALHFLKKHGLLDRPARFDVLAISWPVDRREPEIHHFLNAFEARSGRFQMF